MPECFRIPSTGRLDLVKKCADGACSGDTFSEINEVLGEQGTCWLPTPNQLSYCEWRDGGLRTTFFDENQDAWPDDGAPARGIFLRDPWDGSDPHGLSLGIPLSCFVQVLGSPESSEIVEVDGERFVSVLRYPGLEIDDRFGGGEFGGTPDGRVERISLDPP